jgi:hypothetical protein
MNAVMQGWNWNAIYLVCFGTGLALSFVAFFAGGLHLHVGHFHVHGAHGGAAKGVRGGHASPINGFTLLAFLCWFGGTGYLLHHANIFGAALVLLFSALSGLAGGGLVFWFLAGVLMPNERTLEAADTEITGVVGHLSSTVRKHGVGEMLYTQNGSRRSAAVRSEDGSAIERGTEVIVMRYAKGIAYVRRWDEFEHGLLTDAPSLPGSRQTEQMDEKKTAASE